MSARARPGFRMIVAAAIAAALATPAEAQTASKSSSRTVQGFNSGDRSKPIQIEASSLEVRDKDKVATFTGNVKVVQGDTTVWCKSMVVYYEEQTTPGGARPAGTGLGGGSQQISKLEARGGVKVVQKDQTATGDTGHFDMRANTVTLIGNVVVSQGRNVLRGERMVVDMTTGVSTVISGNQPVRGLFEQQDQNQPAAPDAGNASAPAQQPSRSPLPRLGPRPFPSN